MKKTSAFSPTRVSMAVAVVCVGISMPAFAQMDTKMTGRVHYDARVINSDLSKITDRDSATAGDSFELRRARIGFTGSYNKQIQFEGVANAVGSTTNIIDSAFINYGYNKQGQVRVGRFKQPFSLEETTSSNNIDFMERSYVNQIIPGKKLGIMVHGANEAGFTYGASVYQQDFNELTNQSPIGSQYALRLTGNLAKLTKIGDESTVVHVGVGAVKGKYEQTAATSGNTVKDADSYTRSTIVSFRDENRGLANAYRLQIGGDQVTTEGYGVTGNGVINIAQNMNGLELAVAQGPFKFQAEMANSKYDANTNRCDYNTSSGTCTSFGTANVNATIKTQYLSFLWNITGEDFGKSYANGTFGGIKPASEFMKDYGGVVGNGTGAWQVGYRVSSYDATVLNLASGLSSGTLTEYKVNDGSSTYKSRAQNSPTATTQTFAVNWILNSNARVMFNYATTKFGSSVEYLDTDTDGSTTKREDIFSIRTQFNF
jgi:phosphate-selective porin OprO/OprP